MKYATIIAGIIFSVFLQCAHATELGAITGSNHFDKKKNYNENNPGLYIIHGKYIVGTYKNSYHTTTSFAGRMISTRLLYKRFKLSLGYGLSYGYGWDGGYSDPAKGGAKLLLFVLPTLSVKYDDFCINTHVFGNAAAWSVSIDW